MSATESLLCALLYSARCSSRHVNYNVHMAYPDHPNQVRTLAKPTGRYPRLGIILSGVEPSPRASLLFMRP